MSVQKLIAEAEKLLDKKKIPDALERFKSALALDPLNQLVSSRLATIYLDQGDRAAAARAYAELAVRLAEAGKNGMAVAFYKQAIEITPENMDLRVVYAKECEEMGKIGDAQTQGQMALQHFLRRKKYLDASGVMPLLIRLGNRDDLKAAWIEVIQLAQGEQKLPHLLVALCGPPGMISSEFNVGGDAALLSEGLYEGLKGLVNAFPRDPRVPYAVAWAASRKGRRRDFYENLRECIRREPDFCLAYTLWARLLAEEGRLSEALFVFKLLKDRMPADRSVDMAMLNRLVDAFVEKSPWISAGPTGGARELEPAEFVSAFGGGSAAVAEPATAVPPNVSVASPAVELAPAPSINEPIVARETDISFGIVLDQNFETVAPLAAAPVVTPPAAVALKPRTLDIAPEPPQPKLNAAPFETPAATLISSDEPFVDRGDSVEFTNLIKITPEFRAEEEGGAGESFSAEGAHDTAETDPSALLMGDAGGFDFTSGDATPPPTSYGRPAPSAAPGFNPLTVMEHDAAILAQEEREEKTEMFSPLDVLGAQEIARGRYEQVKTKIIEEAAPAFAVPQPSVNPGLEGMFVEGDATQVFSPMEAVAAAGDSRRPLEWKEPPAPVPPLVTKVTVSSLELSVETSAPEDVPEAKLEMESASAPSAPSAPPAAPVAGSLGEFVLPVVELVAQPTVTPEAEWDPETDGGGATQIISSLENLSAEPTGVMIPDSGPVMPAAPVVSFQPIPAAAKPAAPKPVEAAPIAPAPIVAAPIAAPTYSPPEAPAEEMVDLGDDLLQEPTRVVLMPPKLLAASAESTRHLLREVRKELKENKAEAPDADAMLRRAERYIVKQNYYLARKALRLARELGADEDRVKSRLRDIRKIELPESVYRAASDDEQKRERSADIIERLELEFGINEAEEEGGGLLGASVTEQLEQIFRENDARTILDFGVGLHEMGLFAQAEELFVRITEQYPEHAFDAYYLAAVAKFSQRDYAGAASILKHLCAEVGKSEAEKIQVYYTLGELFERMERPDSSREFFEKVAGLDSNYRNVRNKLEG